MLSLRRWQGSDQRVWIRIRIRVTVRARVIVRIRITGWGCA